MSFKPLYRYITGKELAEMIKSDKQPLKDYVVVDVRDDDFLGGNIVNCLRSPSETFEEDLDGLIEKTKGVHHVIFHCALSQQRGPKAALTYAKRRQAEKEATSSANADGQDEQEVLVLRGGFTEFQSAFKRYARARKAEQEALEDIDQPSKNEAEEKKQEIFVLKGGFAEFQQVYKDDPDLVVNWSEEVWGEENWEEEVDRDDEVLELDD
ncbi:hypothetical protein FRB90_000016 [Tulasnella sp. 427]|nr:hypothetical protein FRB90_000016 [Tulasnella sp. 427]